MLTETECYTPENVYAELQDALGSNLSREERGKVKAFVFSSKFEYTM